MINPKDNDADGVDENSGYTVVNLSSDAVVSSFEIRLNDGLEPADPNEGVGIADNTVTTETVVLRRNGEFSMTVLTIRLATTKQVIRSV